MNIEGKFVTLRAMELEDMEMLRSMLNDPEMEYQVVGWSFPIASYQQNKWFESAVNDDKNKRFVIETEEDGAMGLITLGPIDWKNRSAVAGIKLSKLENRKRGVGTDALMALMRYAFDELNLHRLESTQFPNNKASEALFVGKCGWSIEGTARKAVYKSGEYLGLHFTSILEDDYSELIAKNNYWED